MHEHISEVSYAIKRSEIYISKDMDDTKRSVIVPDEVVSDVKRSEIAYIEVNMLLFTPYKPYVERNERI